MMASITELLNTGFVSARDATGQCASVTIYGGDGRPESMQTMHKTSVEPYVRAHGFHPDEGWSE